MPVAVRSLFRGTGGMKEYLFPVRKGTCVPFIWPNSVVDETDAVGDAGVTLKKFPATAPEQPIEAEAEVPGLAPIVP